MSEPIIDPLESLEPVLEPVHPMAEPLMTPVEMGRKGGLSRSKRKLQAARKNIAKAHAKANGKKGQEETNMKFNRRPKRKHG